MGRRSAGGASIVRLTRAFPGLPEYEETPCRYGLGGPRRRQAVTIG